MGWVVANVTLLGVGVREYHLTLVAWIGTLVFVGIYICIRMSDGNGDGRIDCQEAVLLFAVTGKGCKEKAQVERKCVCVQGESRIYHVVLSTAYCL